MAEVNKNNNEQDLNLLFTDLGRLIYEHGKLSEELAHIESAVMEIKSRIQLLTKAMEEQQ